MEWILNHRFEIVLHAYPSPLILFHSVVISAQLPPFSFNLKISRSSAVADSQLRGIGIPFFLRSLPGVEDGVTSFVGVDVGVGAARVAGVVGAVRACLVRVGSFRDGLRRCFRGVEVGN